MTKATDEDLKRILRMIYDAMPDKYKNPSPRDRIAFPKGAPKPKAIKAPAKCRRVGDEPSVEFLEEFEEWKKRRVG